MTAYTTDLCLRRAALQVVPGQRQPLDQRDKPEEREADQRRDDDGVERGEEGVARAAPEGLKGDNRGKADARHQRRREADCRLVERDQRVTPERLALGNKRVPDRDWRRQDLLVGVGAAGVELPGK